MKKLTDVYIKVTKQNKEELKELIHIKNITVGAYLIFSVDHLFSFDFENEFGLEDRKKVSLAELKRLIDTIPTREEIDSSVNEFIRLTKTYKSKHLLEFLKINNDLEHKSNKIALDLLEGEVIRLAIENAKLKQRKWWQIWK